MATNRVSVGFKASLLVVFVVALTAFFILVAPRGPFSRDEGIYRLMVSSFASGHGLFVANGYQELPSPELTLGLLSAHGGELSAQYPFLYAVLYAPFYLLLGVAGLFLPNILAFAATILLTFVLARQLFDDVHLALDASLVLALASFLVEYAAGIWPHSLTVALTTGAFCLVVHSARASVAPWLRWTSAIGAGFALGLAVGLRLDAVLVAAGLAVPLLGMGAFRVRRTLLFLVGLAPSLLAMTVLNGLRFGVWSPFSYGTPEGPARLSLYLPVAALGAGAVLVAWAVTRPGVFAVVRERRLPVLVLGTGALLLLALTPPVRPVLRGLARGGYALVVDLAAYSGSNVTRAPGGSIMYYETFKKALLQSCPWLVALAVPMWDLFRSGRRRREILTLLAAVVPVIAVFSSRGWEGGLSFNMRYFLGALPAGSILAAHTLGELARGRPAASGWKRMGTFLILFVTVVVVFASTGPGVSGGAIPLGIRERLVMTTPLVVAGALLVSLIVWMARRRPSTGWTRGLAMGLMVLALSWGLATAYASDLLWSQTLRRHHRNIERAALAALDPNSILFTSVPHPFSALHARGVRLAYPLADGFRDFVPLLDQSLASGRHAYVLEWDLNAFCRNSGRLPGYRAVPVMDEAGTTVLELRPVGEDGGQGGSSGTPPAVSSPTSAARGDEKPLLEAPDPCES